MGSTVYYRSWDEYQWFAFFGVVNNVIGLTAAEDALIRAHTKTVLGLPDDKKYGRTEYGAPLNDLIANCVYNETGSIIATVMIINAWSIDPDRRNDLLRGFAPRSSAQSIFHTPRSDDQ